MKPESADTFGPQFAAALLRAEAAHIGRDAARRLLAKQPRVAERYRPDAESKWAAAVESRVHELAAAIAVSQVQLFRSCVLWAKVAFEARGVPESDLESSLVALGEVLSERLTPEDATIATEYVTHAIDAIRVHDHMVSSDATRRSPMADLADSFMLALLEGDRNRACRVLVDEAQRGADVRAIYDNVIIPVMTDLGRMWHVGEITVAEEHFATATTLMAMSQLHPYIKRKPATGRTMIAASVDGNSHELGVRMVADAFESEGWRVVYLGPSVPAQDLAHAVLDFGADLLALSVALPTQIQIVTDTIAVIRHACQGRQPFIIVGGLAFAECPDAWKTTGADAFATSPADAVSKYSAA
ncbi:MAG: cobalamin-dependent protein [Planctomycetota bacterium]|nr:cobalamin-dependent protein [Planctomycetota bacterium]